MAKNNTFNMSDYLNRRLSEDDISEVDLEAQMDFVTLNKIKKAQEEKMELQTKSATVELSPIIIVGDYAKDDAKLNRMTHSPSNIKPIKKRRRFSFFKRRKSTNNNPSRIKKTLRKALSFFNPLKLIRKIKQRRANRVASRQTNSLT